MMEPGEPLIITSKKNPRDKFGRWLGEVWIAGDVVSLNLNDQMLNSRNAAPM